MTQLPSHLSNDRLGDEDSDASDSEFSIESDHFGWGHSTSQITIRVPRSDEEWCQKYERLRGQIREFISLYIEIYFIAMVVIQKDGFHDLPVIVVLTDEAGFSQLPEIARFPESLFADSDIVWSLGIGDFESFYEVGLPVEQRYQLHPTSGCSVGGTVDHKSSNGTAGCFIRVDQLEYIGITCGHVVDKGRSVQQPWIKDFHKQVKLLKSNLAFNEKQITQTTNMVTKYECEETRDAIATKLEKISGLLGKDDVETRQNIKVGRVYARELDVVHYLGRQCLCDYAIFRLVSHRSPRGQRIEFLQIPEDGVLSQDTWNDLSNWGELTYDLHVRKTGRTTGTTYGFVAGVHASWQGTGIDKPCDEFYVLQEQVVTENMFAKKGDSGAGVIDRDGRLVGFVWGGVELRDIKIIVDKKSKIPDLLEYEKRRQDDGSVSLQDLEEEFIAAFRGECFILVESAEMVRTRADLTGELLADN